MKREKIKSYEEMKGIMERDDYKELDEVSFEDRICYEIEDTIYYLKKSGETLNKEYIEYIIGNMLSEFYEAYPSESSLSYNSPIHMKRFTVVFDINSFEIKEVSAKRIKREEIKDEDIKKYYVPGYSID